MRLFLLFSILFITLQAFGQRKGREVRGEVQDTSGVVLEGVNVHLFSEKDTLRSQTDTAGRFIFKDVISSDFRLSFSLLGFQLQEVHYSLNSLIPNTEIIWMKLRPQPTVLKDVNIYGLLPMLVKGDTIQYNARSFKPREDELVEDLMKRFPGIDINRSGTITAQGQVVTRVKVNGQDFFTGDVLTATRNLPANIIDNIQIIDDYGEQANYSGVKKTKPERIININLKKDRNRGMFGQVTAGIGTDYRYIGSIAANSFDNYQQLSILGSTNNTNTSLFSYGDVSGGGNREKSGADLNSLIDMNDGISRINSFGINFRDAVSEKTNTYGGYVFTDRENETESFTSRESPYKNNTVISDNLLNSTTQNNLHKLNWNLETKPSSSMYLKISPTISYSASNRFGNAKGTTVNKTLSTEQHTVSEERQRIPTFNLETFFNKNFAKPRRNLSLNFTSSLNSDSKRERIDDERFNVKNIFNTVSPVKKEKLSQDITNGFRYNNLQFHASYIEPISVNSFLELNYDFEYSSNRNNRKAYELGTIGTDSVYRDTLYFSYAYKFRANSVGFLYQFNNQKVSYQVGLGFEPTHLSGYTLNREISTTQKSINFVPNARFTYKVNQLSSFALSYKGQNNQPDFHHIQPIKDTSNPQSVLIGNPDLQAEFINDFSLQYRDFNMISGNAFFGNLSFRSVKNKIVASREMVPNTTIQETRFVNTDGYFDTHGYYMYSLALIEEVLNMNISSTANYNNNISFINQEKNRGRNLSFMQGAQVNFMIGDWFAVDFRSSYSLSRSRNTLPAMSNAEVNTLSLGFGGKSYIRDWALSLDIAKRYNDGYGDMIDINPMLFFVLSDINKIQLLESTLFW